jgi:hypothetical protein
LALRELAQYDCFTELWNKHSINGASYAGVCPNRLFFGMSLDADVQAYSSNIEDVSRVGKEPKLEVTLPGTEFDFHFNAGLMSGFSGFTASSWTLKVFSSVRQPLGLTQFILRNLKPARIFNVSLTLRKKYISVLEKLIYFKDPKVS